MSSYAAYPDYIESDTIEDICKKISCHNELDEYYTKYYYPKTFNKALAVSYYKSGNRYVNDYFGIAYSDVSGSNMIAQNLALNNCNKYGKNCEILLVNNRFENKDLYKKLTRSITPKASTSNNSSNNVPSKPQIPFNAHAVGNSWVCGINYYKSGNFCRRVPTNASSTYTSNFFYCNPGFTKSGVSCIKNKTNISSSNNKSITKTTTSKSSSILVMFFNESGPTILFWIALVLFIYFISPKSSSNKKPRKVVITKDTPEIYPQTSPKPKPKPKPKKNSVIASLKQEKVVIPKPEPKIEPINDDNDLVSSETLDHMNELGLPVAELMFQDAVSFLTDDNGTPADLDKAFSFALKSAGMDFDEAKLLVGTMYLLGDGTRKNEEFAMVWHLKATLSSNSKVRDSAKHMLEQNHFYTDRLREFGLD